MFDWIPAIRLLEKLTERLLWQLPRETIDRHLEIPTPLPANVFADARLYPDRRAMLSAIPNDCEVAEVGTWKGDFSGVIAEVLRPSLFHLIDIDFSVFNWTGVGGMSVSKHEGDSSTILNRFPAASLDWIYVDGDHAYEGVRKDLIAGDHALKPGALMTCNDYTNWASLAVSPYGVARAVNEFIIERGYSVEGLALSPWGNHDLLIRKPD